MEARQSTRSPLWEIVRNNYSGRLIDVLDVTQGT